MNFNAVYFLGAGGIGMSALERYFRQQGLFVAGYDRTPSTLTDALQTEGIEIHFEDNPELIPAPCRNPQQTLVVYTPAIPANHQEMAWFRENGFELHKRAQVLGTLTKSMKGLCVAGTHGKTSTSAMTAHLLHQSHVGCNAFLGGITKNYGTNYLLSAESEYVVIEADEFDRGERILLNFAHTFGHAYETVSRYAVPHGSAVALGMMTANAISVRRGMIPQDYADRIAAVCRKILTHVEIKKEYFDLKAVVSAIRKDKKQTDRNITAVLINEKYELSVFRDVEEEEIAFAINHLLSSME